VNPTRQWKLGRTATPLGRLSALTAAGAVALGVCLAPSAAAQTGPRDIIRAFDWLEPYLAVVAKYRTGQVDAAVKEIQKWEKGRLATAAAHLKTLAPQIALPPAPPFQLDVSDLEAAVVLHTEAGMVAFRDGERDAGGIQLGHARVLLDFLTARVSAAPLPGRPSLASRRGRIDDRDWCLAVVTLMCGLREIGEAGIMADAAVGRFPQDAEMRLAAGSVKEELAVAYEREQRLLRRPSAVVPRGPAGVRASAISVTRLVEATRREALAHYAAALELDPSLDEAVIRHARVLTSEGRLNEARASLETRIPKLTDPRLICLGELFLGSIYESEKRLGDAALAYRRAAVAVPGSQTARIALAHVLERAGVADEARAVTEPFLAMKVRRPYDDDPWWVYSRGQYARGLAILDAFRLQVVKR